MHAPPVPRADDLDEPPSDAVGPTGTKIEQNRTELDRAAGLLRFQLDTLLEIRALAEEVGEL